MKRGSCFALVIMLCVCLPAQACLFKRAAARPQPEVAALPALNPGQAQLLLKTIKPDAALVIKNLYFTAPRAEVPKTQSVYVSPKYVNLGRQFISDNQEQFDRLAAIYPVPREVITAILTIETKLGTYEPRYNVLQTFVSMAAVFNVEFWNELVATYGDKYPELRTPEGRAKALKRGQWATSELIAYLGLCEQLNLDPLSQKGSFSGAMGPGQFMPTSFVRFGVDGDGDGVRNPFSMNDMLASIANYLTLAGWNSESETAKRQAVWSYNHHEVYVNSVLNLAAELAAPADPAAPSSPASCGPAPEQPSNPMPAAPLAAPLNQSTAQQQQ
ncbi:MAG: Membrane-bound lytic murein transglycosylase B precursor [Deltaproteobacteria bacterium ADurb.Bin510]|nr:MAG: Membrane-bound lytic murein transglycosylase B precursor [Deltaproteobacteria bacterium ADurb.Bin510]